MVIAIVLLLVFVFVDWLPFLLPQQLLLLMTMRRVTRKRFGLNCFYYHAWRQVLSDAQLAVASQMSLTLTLTLTLFLLLFLHLFPPKNDDENKDKDKGKAEGAL